MACPSRIGYILSRSITTGDFYSGLKHIKISTPTRDWPILPSTSDALSSTQFATGCKTTSRHAVKSVVITASQHAIRRSTNCSNTAKTIIPALGQKLHTQNVQAQARIHTSLVQLDKDKPSKPGGDKNSGTTSGQTLPVQKVNSSNSSQSDPAKQDAGTLVSTAPGGNKSAAPSQREQGSQGPTSPGSGSGQPPGDATGGLPPSQIPPGGSSGDGSEPPRQATTTVKPPVYIPGLRGAYANALYSAAYRKKALDAVEQDLIKIRDIFKRDDLLKQFLLSPNVSKKLKLEGIQSFKKLNLNELCFNLLVVITENERSSKLLSVISAFMELMAAHRGVVECSIISARPLKPGQKERLTQILAKLLPGKTPHTKESVDPSLLGGFILLIGGKHIDMSMKTKFNVFENTIKIPV